MSLSVYDPVKNCFVLKTMETTTINAFHPDFMKTYYPDFMKDFRTIAANQEERNKNKRRKHIVTNIYKREPKKTHINSKTNQRMTMEEVKAEMLKVTTFHIYSRAGVKK